MDFNPFLNKLITERNSAVVEDPLVDLLAEMVKAIVRLEAQQETPASEPSSALTTGPAVKRYGSAIASLDTSRGQFHLTVETGDCSKSILFTWQEWAAIRQLCLTPQPTPELPTPSGSTKDGDLGVAAPDSPASSPEPAQGGSDEHELRVGFDSILYWLDAIREINAGHEGHYQYPLTNIRRIASYYAAPSRTMKEGSERG